MNAPPTHKPPLQTLRAYICARTHLTSHPRARSQSLGSDFASVFIFGPMRLTAHDTNLTHPPVPAPPATRQRRLTNTSQGFL